MTIKDVESVVSDILAGAENVKAADGYAQAYGYLRCRLETLRDRLSDTAAKTEKIREAAGATT